MSSSDDEDDEPVVAKPTLKGKGKAPEKRKRYVLLGMGETWSLSFVLPSPGLDDSDDDVPDKPAAKKAKITDFLGKAGTQRKISKSMKPASPPKPKSRAASNSKAITVSDSDDEMADYAVPKKTVPARTARGATKKYVEIASDDSGEDGSMFEDD
jgi:DNA topoisomerase-2